VVKQLLAAGAGADSEIKVRGREGGDRGGLGGRTQLCVSSGFSCFVLLKFQVSLRGLVRGLVTLLRCKRGNVTDSPTHQLKQILRSYL
jgi:hypothetical protein